LVAVLVEENSPQIALRTPKEIAWARFTKNKVGVFAGSASLFFLLAAFLAPVITRVVGVNSRTRYEGSLSDFGMPLGRFGGVSLAHP